MVKIPKPGSASLKSYAWLLIIGSSIGLLAAIILMVEKIHLLKQPAASLSCDLNPIIACGSVINTWQANAFGFPNPIIGIAGFAIVLTVGLALLAGAQFKRWFWLGLQSGTLFGVLFIHWLFYQSVYSINALCPYCMVVWIVTIPIFVYTLLWNLRAGHITTPRILRPTVDFLKINHLGVVILWYFAILALILNHFWYFFGA